MNKNEIISGVGFFSDAYDLFIINIVLLILDKVYNINSGGFFFKKIYYTK